MTDAPSSPAGTERPSCHSCPHRQRCHGRPPELTQQTVLRLVHEAVLEVLGERGLTSVKTPSCGGAHNAQP